jgi:hypothetical protein
MTSVTIGTAATVSPVEQSAHTVPLTPASTAAASTGSALTRLSISYPNPSLRLDYQLGLVVIEFRDPSGAVTRTIPSAQQLAAYQQWSETGAGTNPLSIGLVPTTATGSAVSPHQVGIPLPSAGTATGNGTNTGTGTGTGGNAPATTPTGTAAPSTSATAAPTPIGTTSTPSVAPVGGTTDTASPAVITVSAPPPAAPIATTPVAADQPAH